jgi:hypothetical protein
MPPAFREDRVELAAIATMERRGHPKAASASKIPHAEKCSVRMAHVLAIGTVCRDESLAEKQPPSAAPVTTSLDKGGTAS